MGKDVKILDLLYQKEVKYDELNSLIYESIAYPILITHNISPNLKHAIHTRAP